MKTFVKKRAALLLLCFALIFPAHRSHSEPYLKVYDAPRAKISAGFIPYKTQVVGGEPLQVTFFVENLGPTNFAFWFDWNHRGGPGRQRLKIVITDTTGKPLADPYADWGGSWISTMCDLKPGQTFSNVVDLTDICILNKPGVYNVDCSFRFDSKDEIPSDLFVKTAFSLTILQRTPERTAKVLDELIAKARESHGNDLQDTLALVANFGKGDAVPRLGSLSKDGPIELRTDAIKALSLIPGEASSAILLEEFKDPDPAIRAAAASSLGAMQDPGAVDALLEALPKEKSPVAEAILLALGTSKSERAFPAITNALDADNIQWQRAAIKALVNFGGSNAISALKEHINTNYLPVRYEIVFALGENLRQPIQGEWLLPVLMGREQNSQWLDSLRLLRLYAGDQAIPTLLSCLDFDVAWSERNWWILNEVEARPNAPHFNYEHDPNSDGTLDQWTNNLRILQSLRPLAGPIPTPPVSPTIPPVQNLITDPPIDFTPSYKEISDGGIEIKSGFLTVDFLHNNSEYLPYAVPVYYRAIYQDASLFRSLPQDSKKLSNEQISPEQLKQLNDLLHQFAVKLCGSHISDQKIGNFYNLLVHNSGYCPGDGDWTSLLLAYKEAPPWLREQTKADLINSVHAFSQNYHSGTVEFASDARKIFTPEQLKQILD